MSKNRETQAPTTVRTKGKKLFSVELTEELADFLSELATVSQRSRNHVICILLEFATKDKILARALVGAIDT